MSWEEVGYPQHNGIFNNITSTREFILNFGAPLNPVSGNATYRVKVSNGEGNFNQIRFYDSAITPIYNGADKNKILEVTQWGNIQWISFEEAFVLCANMNVTATDSPNLSLVTSTKEMFYICSSLIGNASFNNWNTSTLTSINSMFSAASLFNAPIGNWNVSNVTDFYATFDMASNFNQPLRNWNTSNATTMEHMFHGANSFNQNIDTWNTTGVTNMDMMFAVAQNFNQNLGSWNLSSLNSAVDMLNFSGLNCQNYDSTIFGWNNNAQTPNNINLGTVLPLTYKHTAALAAKNNLINNKNWTITGDTYNANCVSVLSTKNNILENNISLYPNPATDYIYLKNLKNIESYIIFDSSGRIVLQGKFNENKIDIRNLSLGIYTLQIKEKDSSKNFKFVKK